MNINNIGKEFGQTGANELENLLKNEFEEKLEINEIFYKNLVISIKELTDQIETSKKFFLGRTFHFTKNYSELMKNREFMSKIIDIQNKINILLGQTIILTLVVKNDEGEREIYFGRNSIDHLTKSLIYNTSQAAIDKLKKFEISKKFDQAAQKLLQSTAQEIDTRLKNFKPIILWKMNKNWQKILLFNEGPINEAFTAFYVHEQQLQGSLKDFFTDNELPINDFIKNKQYGMINADTAPGTIIGDVSLGNGIQLAVKGENASLQRYSEVLAMLKKFVSEDLEPKKIIEKFINWAEERQKEKRSLIIDMAEEEVNLGWEKLWSENQYERYFNWSLNI